MSFSGKCFFQTGWGPCLGGVGGFIWYNLVPYDTIWYHMVRSGQSRSDQVKSDQVRSGQSRSEQVSAGQIRSEQVRAGQIRSEHVRSDHDYDHLRTFLAITWLRIGPSWI